MNLLSKDYVIFPMSHGMLSAKRQLQSTKWKNAKL